MIGRILITARDEFICAKFLTEENVTSYNDSANKDM